MTRRRWCVWIAVVSACVLGGAGLRVAVTPSQLDLSDEWKPLLARCSKAIREAQPLDVDGLAPVDVSKAFERDLVGQAARSRILGFSRGRFLIVEKENGPPHAVNRACNVTPNIDNTSIDRNQIALMVNEFIRMQFFDRNQEMNIISLSPFVMIRSDETKINSNGCATTTALFYNPRGTASHEDSLINVTLMTGEQGKRPCGGPSHLSPKDNERL